jgi:hypothetical protein
LNIAIHDGHGLLNAVAKLNKLNTVGSAASQRHSVTAVGGSRAAALAAFMGLTVSLWKCCGRSAATRARGAVDSGSLAPSVIVCHEQQQQQQQQAAAAAAA